MALIARFLIDTSAAARMTHPIVRKRLEPLIAGGAVATCATLEAQALYKARSSGEYEQIRVDRRLAYEYLPTDDEHWQRAFDAQRELARTGRHHAVGIADLLTATLAAQHRLTVLHFDADFDPPSGVIEFEHRWVVPRGAVSGAGFRQEARRVAAVSHRPRITLLSKRAIVVLQRMRVFPLPRWMDDAELARCREMPLWLDDEPPDVLLHAIEAGRERQ